MLEEWKKHFSIVIHGAPGKRFIAYYLHRREERRAHPVKRALLIAAGIALIAAGAGLGFVPGVPGIFLGIPGLAIIAGQFRAAASFLDRAELALRRFAQRVRSVFGSNGPLK